MVTLHYRSGVKLNKHFRPFYSIILILKINEFNLTGFIVGIPLDEKGKMTTQAIDCKNYGQLLSNELKLPFSYVNEHSSTWESSERFGIKKDKSGLIDSFSAKIILEQWIEEGPELEEIAGKRQIKY